MIDAIITKRLNNTELGKGNTHETYISIPTNLLIHHYFPYNKELEFYDIKTNEKIILKVTRDKEIRVVGLGPYYRKYDLNAGDTIILECKKQDNIIKYYLDCRKHDNIIVFNRTKNGYEILNENRIPLINGWNKKTKNKLTIKILTTKKKRKDSPFETKLYEIKIDGLDFSDVKYGEIIFEDSEYIVKNIVLWKKYIMGGSTI